MGLRTFMFLRLAAAAIAVTVNGSSSLRRHRESRVAPHVLHREGTASVLDRVIDGVDEIIEGVAEALDDHRHHGKARRKPPATVQLQDMQYSTLNTISDTTEDAEAHPTKAHRKPASVRLQGTQHSNTDSPRYIEADAGDAAGDHEVFPWTRKPNPETRSEIMAAADRAEAREEAGEVHIQFSYMVYTYFRMIFEQLANSIYEWFSSNVLGQEPKKASLADAAAAGSTAARQELGSSLVRAAEKELASSLIRAAENVKQRLIEERNKLSNSAVTQGLIEEGNKSANSAATSEETMEQDDGTEVITRKDMNARIQKGLVDEVMDTFEGIVQKEYTQDGLRTMLAGAGGPEDVAKQVAARMRRFLQDSLGAKRDHRTVTLAGADASSEVTDTDEAHEHSDGEGSSGHDNEFR